MQVHAAAITRDELEWPIDRLPAIPSYELSGVVAAVADDVDSVAVGDAVYGLTPFDRDGAAAEYAAVPRRSSPRSPRRSTTSRARRSRCRRSAPGRGCSTTAAYRRRACADTRGGRRCRPVRYTARALARRLRDRDRVAAEARAARDLGADEVDRPPRAHRRTVGPSTSSSTPSAATSLLRAPSSSRRAGGSSRSPRSRRATGTYFVVEPNREQLVELARLVEAGGLRVAIDSTFALSSRRLRSSAASLQRSAARSSSASRTRPGPRSSKSRPTGTLAPPPRAPSHVFVAESSCGTPAMRRGPVRLSGPTRPATRPARRR